MNITDLNNKIYGHKDLKEGEYANFIMKSIEQQELSNLNINSNLDIEDINKKFGIVNKEIKF